MTSLVRSFAIAWVVVAALACGSSDSGETSGGGGGAAGAGAVGAPCATSGSEAICTAGAICGKPSDGTTGLACLKTCTMQSDCGATEDCNGVEGSSTKGCRPKKGAGTGGTGGAAGGAGAAGGGSAGAGG